MVNHKYSFFHCSSHFISFHFNAPQLRLDFRPNQLMINAVFSVEKWARSQILDPPPIFLYESFRKSGMDH